VSVPASTAAPDHTAEDHGPRPVTYRLKTLDNNADPTFNHLLGINDRGVIAGYFGSGTPATAHPNKGYVPDPPYGQGDYVNENVPGSVQTQVTGLNDRGQLVGFYLDRNGNIDGMLGLPSR
jgi:hypothetical protein